MGARLRRRADLGRWKRLLRAREFIQSHARKWSVHWGIHPPMDGADRPGQCDPQGAAWTRNLQRWHRHLREVLGREPCTGRGHRANGRAAGQRPLVAAARCSPRAETLGAPAARQSSPRSACVCHQHEMRIDNIGRGRHLRHESPTSKILLGRLAGQRRALTDKQRNAALASGNDRRRRTLNWWLRTTSLSQTAGASVTGRIGATVDWTAQARASPCNTPCKCQQPARPARSSFPCPIERGDRRPGPGKVTRT